MGHPTPCFVPFVETWDYSYLSASIGSKREARIAGSIPLTSPTTARINVAMSSVSGSITRRMSPPSACLAIALYKVNLGAGPSLPANTPHGVAPPFPRSFDSAQDFGSGLRRPLDASTLREGGLIARRSIRVPSQNAPGLIDHRHPTAKDPLLTKAAAPLRELGRFTDFSTRFPSAAPLFHRIAGRHNLLFASKC